jgi:cell wall-associated NlpC family hydrolase
MRVRATALILSLMLLTLVGCSDPAKLLSNLLPSGTGGTEWDAGNIISDQVFYNSSAFATPAAVQAAEDKVGGGCVLPTCLRTATYTTTDRTSLYCEPYSGGVNESYATILFKLGKACGINPQVAIVMIIKESGGFSKPIPPTSLTGFVCPDTGPNGSANCNATFGGVWAQTYGMFEAFAKLRKDASKVNYLEGRTHQILWNVVETGCGTAPVAVANRATATLYTYTPYQPNAASLAAFPGVGDNCSSYGNRNFFKYFIQYFGATGGGKSSTASAPGTVVANGPNITLPDNQYVAAAVRGKTIQAPTAAVAKGIAAGLGYLGTPYVWGGGGDGAGPNNGCSRGGGAYNSCGAEIGFDCSGLTAYVYVSGGMRSPGGSSGVQRSGGMSVPYSAGLSGDIVGFPGHVAILLVVDGAQYILEASWVGTPIHVVPLTRGDRDGSLHRHWSPSSA